MNLWCSEEFHGLFMTFHYFTFIMWKGPIFVCSFTPGSCFLWYCTFVTTIRSPSWNLFQWPELHVNVFVSPFFLQVTCVTKKRPWLFYIGIIHWYNNTISLNWYGGSWDIYRVDSEPFLWDSFFKPKVPWNGVVFVAALFISGSSKKRSQKVNLPVVVFFFFLTFLQFLYGHQLYRNKLFLFICSFYVFTCSNMGTHCEICMDTKDDSFFNR